MFPGFLVLFFVFSFLIPGESTYLRIELIQSLGSILNSDTTTMARGRFPTGRGSEGTEVIDSCPRLITWAVLCSLCPVIGCAEAEGAAAHASRGARAPARAPGASLPAWSWH